MSRKLEFKEINKQISEKWTNRNQDYPFIWRRRSIIISFIYKR